MIYMGYDLINQGCVFVCERGKVFIDDKTVSEAPAAAIINGLIDVSEKIENQIDKDLTVVFTTLFTRKVQFSEQAWSDLLRVGDFRPA